MLVRAQHSRELCPSSPVTCAALDVKHLTRQHLPQQPGLVGIEDFGQRKLLGDSWPLLRNSLLHLLAADRFTFSRNAFSNTMLWRFSNHCSHPVLSVKLAGFAQGYSLRPRASRLLGERRLGCSSLDLRRRTARVGYPSRSCRLCFLSLSDITVTQKQPSATAINMGPSTGMFLSQTSENHAPRALSTLSWAGKRTRRSLLSSFCLYACLVFKQRAQSAKWNAKFLCYCRLLLAHLHTLDNFQLCCEVQGLHLFHAVCVCRCDCLHVSRTFCET